jgi:hypothetical protein
VLSRQKILDLVSFLEAGDDLPPGLRHEPKKAATAAGSRPCRSAPRSVADAR